ncbi:MAG: fumarylacetoacetate hydrolase family protein [Aeropyrum sp.]|nr:fumarylacetoacetate hydrolase family protein [Aeropyrum sp.]
MDGYIISATPGREGSLGVIRGDCLFHFDKDVSSILGGIQGFLSSLPHSLRLVESLLDTTTGPCIKLEQQMLSPVASRDRKAFGVGKSFAAHAREMGGGGVSFFVKGGSSLVGHNHPIVVPTALKKVDYEGEIVVVISSKLRHPSSLREVRAALAGYTAGNDVTDRGLQEEMTWSIAKSIDTFGPVGPGLYIPSDDRFLEDLCLETRLNAEVVQKACTSDMVASPESIIMRLASLVTLTPGTIVFLGTPSGVGHARDPPRYLRKGDVVEVKVGYLPALVNRVETSG